MSITAAHSDGTGNNLRNKIIRLLSSTANGCLSELGYFPGMPEQYKQLLQANALLQNDNAKLYEDNRTLARVLARQNDRLAFSAGGDELKLKRFDEMRNKMESLTMELAILKRSNDISVDRGYRNLFAESQLSQAKTDALTRDYKRLRDNHPELCNFIASRGFSSVRQVPPGQRPLVQQTEKTGDMSQPSANRNQRNVIDVPAEITSNYHLTHQVQRRPATDMIPRMPLAQNHVVRQASEGSSQIAQAVGPITSHGYRPNPSTSGMARASSDGARAPPVALSSDLKVSTVPPRLLNSNAQPSTSLAIAPQHSPITLISPNHPGRTTFGFVQEWNPVTTQAPQVPNVIDLTADDDVPAQVAVAVEVPAPITSGGDETRQSPIEEPLSLRRSGYDMAGLQRPASRVESVAIDSPASSVGEPLMKRSMSVMEGTQQQVVPENAPRKRSRTDDFVHPSEVVHQVESRSSEDEDTGPGHEEAAEGIALMSAEDCVAAIFTEDEEKENEQICSLCVLRYERGATEDLPKPYVQPSLDVLIAHCIDEHPMVWEKLRQIASQDQ